MSIYKFVTPFFGTDEQYTADEKSSRSLEKDEISSSDYLDTPCLLLSDDDASSCTDHDDVSVWPISWDTATQLGREGGEDKVEDRRVRFDNARVRLHAMTLGDHPMCCDSLPLSLDWVHSEEIVYDIDDYEAMRRFSGRRERGSIPRLSYWQRKSILQEAGLSSISAECEEHRTKESKYQITEESYCFDEAEELSHGYEDVAVSYNFSFPVNMVRVEIIED